MSDFPSFCDVRLVGRIVSLSGERALVEYRGRTGIVTVRVSVPGGARGKLDDIVRVLGELAEDGHVVVSEDKGEFIAFSADAKTTMPDDTLLSSIPSTAVSPTPEADVALPAAATVSEVSPPSTILPDTVPPAPAAATTTPTPRPALAPPFPARPFGSGLRSSIGRPGIPRPSSTATVVVARQAQPPAVRQPPAGLSDPAGPRSSFQRPGMMRSVGLVSPADVKAAPQQAASLPTATDAPLSPAQTAQTSSTPTTAPQIRPPTPARRSSMMAVSRLSDDDDPRNVPGGDTEQEPQGFHTRESPPVSRSGVVSSSPSRGVPHSRKPPTNPDDIDRDIPF